VNANDIELSTFQETINIARLIKVRTTIESHLDCDDKKRWQQYFENNRWALSQLFSIPMDYYGREINVGGKDLLNKNGNTTILYIATPQIVTYH